MPKLSKFTLVHMIGVYVYNGYKMGIYQPEWGFFV